MSDTNLEGKVAIVTGGASGIGRAACEAFARAGARVCVVDLEQAACERSADALRGLGAGAIGLGADVSLAADVSRYVRATLDTFGRIDCFFNNAGIEGKLSPIVEYDEDLWDRVMNVNVRGVFLGLKYVLPHMIAQRSGAVVNTASVAGTLGAPFMAAYATSKHAVIGLTRSAAGEVGSMGVRVNAVLPGPINTRMQRAIARMVHPNDPDEHERRNIARNPMRREGLPEEVARVVTFLCSDACSYVNGAAWVVDGGRGAV